jgi:hypothetical protein
MFTVDVAMPLMLFAVTLAALLFSGRVEPRLKTTFEEREFKTRDAVLFVVLIAVAVSIVVFVPQMALIAVFLFSYCSLLFTFSYLFSNLTKRKAQIFFLGVGLATLASGAVALLNVYGDSLLMFYGGLAALVLAAFAFGAVLVEQIRAEVKARWYLAVFPPALFLVVFFLFMYVPVPHLSVVLVDVTGALFAVMITLYLASLFTWKVTFIFAALLTVMDIILVLFTGIMVTAATHVAELGLPVLISLPTIPLITTVEGGTLFLSLGLGDFFFAGTLATQTYKKYGVKTAIISAITMTLSFGAFEAFLLSTGFGAFPGTVMIILGWLPVVAWRMGSERKTKVAVAKELV